MSDSELQLFVIWEKARHLEQAVLDDLSRHCEIVFKAELTMSGPAEDFYRQFYSFRSIDPARKVRNCGRGSFLFVVVRDLAPVHFVNEHGETMNRNIFDLKAKYRSWVGRGFRIHATLNGEEFARDVFALTGYRAEEWRQGVPKGPLRMHLPSLDQIPPPLGFVRNLKARVRKHLAGSRPREDLPKALLAQWWSVINGVGAEMGLADCHVLLKNKMANDVFFEGTFKGRPCIVKCSSRTPESIGNEHAMLRRLFAVDPTVCAEPFAHWKSPDGKMAFVVVRKLTGPTLRDHCARGMSEAEADRVADDVLRIARALESSGVVHRDLWVDNLLLDADGHYKLIDFQFALAKDAVEDHPWLKRNWKTRLLIFGYNAALPLGCWNDVCGLRNCLRQMPQTDRVKYADGLLAGKEPAADFRMGVTPCERLKVRMYRVSLLVQRALRPASSPKRAALDRRLRHIRTRLSAARPLPEK